MPAEVMSKFMVESSAPGKVILHGEHAVVFGKNAIATSVNLRTKVRLIVDSNSDQVSLNCKGLFENVRWTLEELLAIKIDFGDVKGHVIPFDEKHITSLEPLLTKFGDKICNQAKDSIRATLLIYLGLCKLNGVDKLLPVEINVDSDLPIGAGMGSSASFSVSLAGALIKAFNVSAELFDPQQASDWAFEIEKLFHGKPSGIDNNICTFGGAILYRKGQIQERLTSVNFLPIILVYTNVKRNTKLLVEKTSSRRTAFPEIIEHVMNSIDSISLNEWKLIKENSDFEKSKLLIEINQHLLNSIGAGHSSIEEVLAVARGFEMTGKLTGAGGGGTVFIALNKDTDEKTTADLIKVLESKGFQCWQVSVGGVGLECNLILNLPNSPTETK